MLEMSTESRDYVQAYIGVTKQGQDFNPTSLTVEFAFTTGTAKPTTWIAGSWDGTQARAPSEEYVAQCLVGPGGAITLAAGTYTMWVRITDSPERPALPFGQLKIT